MTQKEKQLLLQDLCVRLPYGVMANVQYKDGDGWKTEDRRILGIYEDGQVYLDCVYTTVDYIKPYLRSMSSMTEEELKELNEKYGNIAYFFMQEPPYYHGLQAQHSDIGSIEISEFSEIYDWLNVHHFDYRGLIEKGLALEAPEGMYKI